MVCSFREWEAWSLTPFCLLAILNIAFKFSGICVSKRCWNQFGYLSIAWACLSSVSWHTCGMESCAWPNKDLTNPIPSWSGLWGFSMALKYAFCLVCVGGRSSMNLVVSVGVFFVVPGMTLIASFCTLSSFSRFVCAIAARLSPYSLTLWHSRKRWHCSVLFAAIAFKTDRPFLHFSAVFSHLVCSAAFCQSWSNGILDDLFV